MSLGVVTLSACGWFYRCIMKEIPLTQGKVALVDDEDFEWLNTWKWYAGKGSRGKRWYARTGFREQNGTRNIYMHQMLMLFPKKPLQIDHLNHNGLDNQKDNLRVCTGRENMHNIQQKGTSIYPGVNWSKSHKKWVSRISINNKKIWLGESKYEIEAAILYHNAYIADKYF